LTDRQTDRETNKSGIAEPPWRR